MRRTAEKGFGFRLTFGMDLEYRRLEMIGASTMTRNVRRRGIPASKGGKANPGYAEIGMPTSERLSKSEGHFTLGGDERTGRRYMMHDTPLDRALRKGMISGAQHSALKKYRHHWFHAGAAPHFGSVDLNRIFAPTTGGTHGLAITENQCFHAQRREEAVKELGPRLALLVGKLVCEESPLDVCGASLGWKSKPQAIAAATEMLQEAGARLSRLWRIG